MKKILTLAVITLALLLGTSVTSNAAVQNDPNTYYQYCSWCRTTTPFDIACDPEYGHVTHYTCRVCGYHSK